MGSTLEVDLWLLYICQHTHTCTHPLREDKKNIKGPKSHATTSPDLNKSHWKLYATWRPADISKLKTNAHTINMQRTIDDKQQSSDLLIVHGCPPGQGHHLWYPPWASFVKPQKAAQGCWHWNNNTQSSRGSLASGSTVEVLCVASSRTFTFGPSSCAQWGFILMTMARVPLQSPGKLFAKELQAQPWAKPLYFPSHCSPSCMMKPPTPAIDFCFFAENNSSCVFF